MRHLPLSLLYLHWIHGLMKTVWASEVELEPQVYCVLALRSWPNYVNLTGLSFFSSEIWGQQYLLCKVTTTMRWAKPDNVPGTCSTHFNLNCINVKVKKDKPQLPKTKLLSPSQVQFMSLTALRNNSFNVLFGKYLRIYLCKTILLNQLLQ